jgi:sigma-B regulation protein RsbU (phosphoserine phosphatase)
MARAAFRGPAIVVLKVLKYPRCKIAACCFLYNHLTTMATAFPPAQPASAQRVPFRVRLHQFWQRVTEGLELTQLWSQFETEARSSYRLYSRDVASAQTPEGLTRRGRNLHVVKEFFWAVLEKLSPARRVLLLAALIMLVSPHSAFSVAGEGGKVYSVEFDLHFWGGLLLFLLLMLEIADRVVMKRDLQIAREIQTWLLPGAPPQIPGVSIAYVTRPANTVAGDYYDVFPRPGKTNEENRVVFAVADVAGKSIPAAMLMGPFRLALKRFPPRKSLLKNWLRT